MNINRSSLFLVAILISSYSFSGITSYQCTFMQEGSLNNSGKIDFIQYSIALKQMFSVDRNSGAVITPDAASWPYKDSAIKIISSGNKDSAFQVIYTARAAKLGVHTSYLRIEEFVVGQNKPFVVITGSTIQTGLCK